MEPLYIPIPKTSTMSVTPSHVQNVLPEKTKLGQKTHASPAKSTAPMESVSKPASNISTEMPRSVHNSEETQSAQTVNASPLKSTALMESVLKPATKNSIETPRSVQNSEETQFAQTINKNTVPIKAMLLSILETSTEPVASGSIHTTGTFDEERRPLTPGSVDSSLRNIIDMQYGNLEDTFLDDSITTENYNENYHSTPHTLHTADSFDSAIQQSPVKSPSTLSEQLAVLETQNNAIIDILNNQFDVLGGMSTTMDTVKTNLEYLISLIKSRSAGKGTPLKPSASTSSSSSTSTDVVQPVVVISATNPNKVKIGNSAFEMDHEEYINMIQKCKHSPSTFAVKLVSFLFSENELFNKNITGKCNTGKDKLNPAKLHAIISQIGLQFPNYMESKNNSEKIWIAINGKCRKTTEKLNKTVFKNT